MFLLGLFLGLFFGVNLGLFVMLAFQIGAANDTPERLQDLLIKRFKASGDISKHWAASRRIDSDS